jgi:hypothetical protein
MWRELYPGRLTASRAGPANPQLTRAAQATSDLTCLVLPGNPGDDPPFNPLTIANSKAVIVVVFWKIRLGSAIASSKVMRKQ